MPSGRVWNSGLAASDRFGTFFRSASDVRLYFDANAGVTLIESESAALEGVRAVSPLGSAASSAALTSLGELAVADLLRKSRMDPEYSGIRLTSPFSSAGMYAARAPMLRWYLTLKPLAASAWP